MLNIMLTGKGKAIIKEHDRQIIEATRETLSGITDDELSELSVALKSLKKIFSRL
jgi:DNA-binding MarR family transcriptional regulator